MLCKCYETAAVAARHNDGGRSEARSLENNARDLLLQSGCSAEKVSTVYLDVLSGSTTIHIDERERLRKTCTTHALIHTVKNEKLTGRSDTK